MSLIKKANEIELPTTVSVLIYGNPGSGKTTMACSMPKSLIFDMDRGIHRAKNTTADVVQAKSMSDVYEVINSNDIDNYETLIFDTLGRLLDFMIVDILSKNKMQKMRIQDYGTLKSDFDNLMSLIRSKNKNVLFIAHETEEKIEVNGKTSIMKRPDTGVGSAGKSLIKDLDVIGYVRIQDKRPIISFNPNDDYYAKNGYNIEDNVLIPRIKDGEPNTFLTDIITNKVKESLEKRKATDKAYNELMQFLDNEIDSFTKDDIDDFNAFYEDLPNKKHINNSLIVAKKRMVKKAEELGFVADKQTKKFIDPTKIEKEQKKDERR